MIQEFLVYVLGKDLSMLLMLASIPILIVTFLKFIVYKEEK